MNEYNPDVVSIPGDSIREIVKEKGISYKRLRKDLQLSRKQFYHLLWGGTLRITTEIAKGLETFVGGTKEFWISRDKNYCEIRKDKNES
jgi:plasmid maintenance system antidote protein VapI